VKLKLPIKVSIPSLSGRLVTLKVTTAFDRAMKVARARIVPLVVDRASGAVDNKLGTMAPRYKKALQEPGAVRVTEKAVEIKITDPIVVAVERGAKAFDMKAKLLKHAKASSKGSVYVDIPFQHKAGSVPQSMRTAGTRAASAAGGAAEVRLSMRTEGKSFTRSLQRGSIGRALGLSPRKQAVKHSRGVHDDIIRSSTRAGGKSSVRYTTIRRISTKSKPSSWWHPGFKGAHVLDEVLPGLRRDIVAILRNTFSTLKGML
jgi:hypothetical protein